MKEIIRKRVYFNNPSEDALDELYDRFDEVDFLYGNEFITFHGNSERLQEVYRYIKTLGLEVKKR